jgi:hypothetical protein
MQQILIMVNRFIIRTLVFLPFALTIFLTGWCLQFFSSSKKVGQRKKENYDLHFAVIESDEQLVCQPMRR